MSKNLPVGSGVSGSSANWFKISKNNCHLGWNLMKLVIELVPDEIVL